MALRKILAIVVIGAAALLLAGCGILPGGGAAATPVPLPTYTPFPTYTPLPTYTSLPSPTATFPPTATLPPLETPTEVGLVPTSSGEGFQAIVIYPSIMRSGPDLSFSQVTLVPAGTTVLILGRNNPPAGYIWLLVRVPSGKEGWIRQTQFDSSLNLSVIPIATDIPTPSVTNTPKPGVTGTPGTGTPPAIPPVITPSSSSEWLFTLKKGGGQQCISISSFALLGPVKVADPTAGIPPYDSTNMSASNLTVFQLVTTGVPAGVTVSIQGNLTALNIHPTEHTSSLIAFTICAAASSGTSTGKTTAPVLLLLGAQTGIRLDEYFRQGLPTAFNVVP